jgi:hypothetical protein
LGCQNKIFYISQVLVAHAYNLTYSGGRGQEDCGSKPALANSLRDPISKIPITKKDGEVAQGVGPELNPVLQKKNFFNVVIYNQ